MATFDDAIGGFSITGLSTCTVPSKKYLSTGSYSLSGEATVKLSVILFASGSLSIAGYCVYSTSISTTQSPSYPIRTAQKANVEPKKPKLTKVYSQVAATNGWYSTNHSAYLPIGTGTYFKKVKKSTVPNGMTLDDGTIVVDD